MANDQVTPSPPPSSQPEYEELTLRDILLGVGRYGRMLVGYWWVIGGVALISGGWFWWEARQEPVRYEAKLTFMLNEDKGGGGGGLASILGQAGLGGGGGEYSLDKIVELAKSQLIVQRVLLDTVTINGRADRLAHHVITAYGWESNWREDRPAWVGLRFPTDSIATLTLSQRKLLQYIYVRTTKTKQEPALFRMVLQPSVSMLNIVATTVNEELSQVLAEQLYQRLSEFYIEKRTAGPRRTYVMLKSSADSVEQVISSLEYRIARARDVATGIFRNQERVAVEQLERKRTIAQIVYGEAVKNLAAAEFTLRNVTPFFAVVDRPFLPLERQKANASSQGAIGAIIGAFTVTFLLIFRQLIRDVLQE